MLSLCLYSLHLTIQKKQRKFNITSYGEIFYHLIYWHKIKNLEGLHFWKVFYHLKILG